MSRTLPERRAATHLPVLKLRQVVEQPRAAEQSEEGGDNAVRETIHFDREGLGKVFGGIIVGMALMFFISKDNKAMAASSLAFGLALGLFMGAILMYYYFRKKWQRHVSATPDFWSRLYLKITKRKAR